SNLRLQLSLKQLIINVFKNILFIKVEQIIADNQHLASYFFCIEPAMTPYRTFYSDLNNDLQSFALASKGPTTRIGPLIIIASIPRQPVINRSAGLAVCCGV